MVNANDPAAIPYVINENGFWYVAYKEKNPHVPYLTVSAKGVANGLSTEYNDGYDFGPDSYDPSVTGSFGNPPYSQTGGIEEMINYAISVAVENPVTGNYQMPKMQMGAGVFYINEPFTVNGNGKQLENFILSGDSSMSPYIICNINDAYAITLDGGSFVDTNIRFENMQPFVGTGFTPQGFLYTFSGTGAGGNIFEGYNIDIANAGWTGDPLHLNNFEGILMYNYEAYVSDSVGYFSASQYISFLGGSMPKGGPTLYLSGYGTTTSFGAPYVNMFGVGYAGTGQGTNISLDTINSFSVYGGMNIGQITLSTAIEQLSNNNYPFQTIRLYDVYITMQTATSFITASSAVTLNNLFIEGLTFGLLNSPATTVNFLNNVTVGYSRLQYILQLHGNTLTDLPYSSPTISTNPPVTGTPYQNTNPYNIDLFVPITYPTVADTAMTAYLRVGTSSTAGANPIIDQIAEPATLATVNGRVSTLKARVPAGWYYEVDVTTATIGTAVAQAV